MEEVKKDEPEKPPSNREEEIIKSPRITSRESPRISSASPKVSPRMSRTSSQQSFSGSEAPSSVRWRGGEESDRASSISRSGQVSEEEVKPKGRGEGEGKTTSTGRDEGTGKSDVKTHPLDKVKLPPHNLSITLCILFLLF